MLRIKSDGSHLYNSHFARVLESAVPFFERNGYTSRGKIKTGKRLKTQVMVKSSLLTLAGRVSAIYRI